MATVQDAPQAADARNATNLSERVGFVKGQYERLWENVYQKAEVLLERGETNLARLHLFMRRDFGDEFYDPYLQAKYRKKEEERRKQGFIYDRQWVQFYDVESRITTKMLDAVKMQEIINACGQGTRRVIETGAGWGKTLFNVWLHGGPRQADYHAMEITEAGRKTAELIALRAAAGMKLKAHYYNHYEPDYSFLKENLPTVVFSHHSIEQIPQLGANYVDALLGIPGFQRCVHLEPVGFQVPSDNWLRAPRSVRVMHKVDRLNRNFTEKHNQNKNLYPLLIEQERLGKIKITVVRKHFCSTILHNATTLIIWEKPGVEPGEAPSADARRDDLALSSLNQESIAKRPRSRWRTWLRRIISAPASRSLD
jgi:hypothetical protein